MNKPNRATRDHLRVRVVIVDDSAVVRGFLSRWLSESDDVELVGAASNGLEAVALAAAVKPDVVILDIEMPEMSGVEALPLIRVAAPDAAVIVSSRLTRQNAELALRCLEAGASEILPKPTTDANVAPLRDFQRELVEKVRALGRRAPAAGRAKPSPAPRAAARAAPQAPPRAILIGASTGGPNACAELISALKPLAARLPILVAQHMPPVFTRVFSEHLANITGVAAREARDGELLKPGLVLVAPGGHHVTVGGSADRPTVIVDDRPPVRFSRPSVDLLFQSARDLFGARIVGVVLTGMGSDGLEGARALSQAGAQVYVQDEASSVVWGMPGAIARAGLANHILPPAAIAASLVAALD